MVYHPLGRSTLSWRKSASTSTDCPTHWLKNSRAGGGGAKSENRKSRLQEKNVRLNEQRKRRIEQEEKTKKRQDKKQKQKAGETGKGLPEQEDASKNAPSAIEQQHEGMHPARMARLGG